MTASFGCCKITLMGSQNGEETPLLLIQPIFSFGRRIGQNQYRSYSMLQIIFFLDN
jgi:hypothetical protein